MLDRSFLTAFRGEGQPLKRQHKMDVQRTLIILGLVLVAAGLLWPFLGKLGLGRLPGDIAIERENFRLYIPIGTSILISVVLMVLFWLFRR
jgi:hypothetical protein